MLPLPFGASYAQQMTCVAPAVGRRDAVDKARLIIKAAHYQNIFERPSSAGGFFNHWRTVIMRPQH
ncbi:hypothetical protein [Atopomonas sediminilitoris]|uniref:hypothetical protein n=1 Tax=Atopomonas sediminilitoris TaxID=2919919 RepID=UPI001F4E19D2|nr:hypothetical protein [Atopomonas sediminilitoris]MCJ8168072.1 hypothetical protein [Atopomonas sediminilitoris]